jgi:hypothetical protein
LDDLIRLFVGRTDAMTFAQLEPLLEAAGIKSLDAINGEEQIRDIHQRIVEGQLGVQSIVGDAYAVPFGPEQLQLPRAFVLTGQRFNADGWALGQVIFDRISWDEEIPGYTFGGKVIRRYCSALDMAYSALGNHQIGWEIVQRMLNEGNRSNFRDGLPYAHNLISSRWQIRSNASRPPPGKTASIPDGWRLCANCRDRPQRCSIPRRCAPGHGRSARSTRNWRRIPS